MIKTYLARFACAALMAGAILNPAAGHADAKLLSDSKGWRAYSMIDNTGKVCYVAGSPPKKDGVKARGDTYVMVTNRTNGAKRVSEVSVTGGVTFKKDSDVEVIIGAFKAKMFTKDATAFARDDEALINAMLNGQDMAVRSASAKGEGLTDKYTLAGFPQAYKEILAACAMKPTK